MAESSAVKKKRVFPPEWYAAQAARRKQRTEAKALGTSSTLQKSKVQKQSLPSKVKSSSIQKATYRSYDGKMPLRASFQRQKGGKTETSDYFLRDSINEKGISQYSFNRLKRVLESKRKDKSGRVVTKKTKQTLWEPSKSITTWSRKN